MKRFLIVLAVILIIPAAAFGEEYEEYNSEQEYSNYLNSFDLSSFELLDKDTKDFLAALEIDDFDYEKITSISFSDVASHIFEVITKQADAPIKCAMIIIAYIILSSFFTSFSPQLGTASLSQTYSTVSALAISIFLTYRLSDCIALSCSTIKICAGFAFAFFPAFCIIAATSGAAMTSFSVNTTLLILAQGLNYISELIFMPVTNCFLALGICSGIRSELNLSGTIAMLKKGITTAISTISAVFVSILSIKTSVAARADAIGLRSVRFAINSVVPVIGSSISEGLLSIQSYSSLIKTSVGVVGIIAVAAIFLPSIVEVNLWRLVLSIASSCGEIFGETSAIKAVNAFKDALLIMDVLLILTMVTTIISIGILVAAKTAV